MRRGDLPDRWDPLFCRDHLAHRDVRSQYAPLGSLLAQRPDYGVSATAIPRIAEEQWRYIRTSDFGEDGIPADHEFMAADRQDEAKLLEGGDILFARSGFKAGKTLLFDPFYSPALFAGYCIRVRVDQRRVLAEFVYEVTKTQYFDSWRESVRRPGVQRNINAQEIKGFPMPLPGKDVQARLLASLEQGRAERDRIRQEADALLTSLDGYVLDALGVVLPEHEPRPAYAVRLADLRNNRIDAPAHSPLPRAILGPHVGLRPLREVATIDGNPRPKPDESGMEPYIGLPECDLTSVREVATRLASEVRGRSVALPGDILFARIEPSIFNRKYVYAETLLGHPYAYTSTEFYVVSGREGEAETGYLYALLFTEYVQRQIRLKTTGSSGRRRLDPPMFANLQIPIPHEPALQTEIATEVQRRRREARRLQAEAERVWREARARFEADLFGGG